MHMYMHSAHLTPRPAVLASLERHFAPLTFLKRRFAVPFLIRMDMRRRRSGTSTSLCIQARLWARSRHTPSALEPRPAAAQPRHRPSAAALRPRWGRGRRRGWAHRWAGRCAHGGGLVGQGRAPGVVFGQLQNPCGGQNARVFVIVRAFSGLVAYVIFCGGSVFLGFVRESVLFIGTQFSILYTFMYSPA
jgi:hypothetical protein